MIIRMRLWLKLKIWLRGIRKRFYFFCLFACKKITFNNTKFLVLVTIIAKKIKLND